MNIKGMQIRLGIFFFILLLGRLQGWKSGPGRKGKRVQSGCIVWHSWLINKNITLGKISQLYSLVILTQVIQLQHSSYSSVPSSLQKQHVCPFTVSPHSHLQWLLVHLLSSRAYSRHFYHRNDVILWLWCFLRVSCAHSATPFFVMVTPAFEHSTFANPFVCWWGWSLFHVLFIVNGASMNIRGQQF